MQAYLIRRELPRAWAHLDLTVEEGLDRLKTLCIMHVRLTDDTELQQIPTPRAQSKALLNALGVKLPPYVFSPEVRVVTKKKLPLTPRKLLKTRAYARQPTMGLWGNIR